MIAIYNGEQFECGIDGEKIILYSNNQQDGFERSIARYKKVVNRKDCLKKSIFSHILWLPFSHH